MEKLKQIQKEMVAATGKTPEATHVRNFLRHLKAGAKDRAQDELENLIVVALLVGLGLEKPDEYVTGTIAERAQKLARMKNRLEFIERFCAEAKKHKNPPK